jgi:hypothetical protein
MSIVEEIDNQLDTERSSKERIEAELLELEQRIGGLEDLRTRAAALNGATSEGGGACR